MNKEELKELYLKWIDAEKKANELKKALNKLEKIAKKFTNEKITASCSMFDGVYIIWEDFNIWGLTTLYSPQDFISACENRG